MAESRKALDTKTAEAYKKLLVPTLSGLPAAAAVEAAAPRPGERMLDRSWEATVAPMLSQAYIG